MITWLRRISISEKVAGFLSSHLYYEKVVFCYLRFDGRCTEKVMRLCDAILLAERRREDRRYKNYEFLIY